jgi:hypothetical protein
LRRTESLRTQTANSPTESPGATGRRFKISPAEKTFSVKKDFPA